MQKNNKLAQFKQWILSIVIGRFRYKYEYYSPFGECWSVYRLWFGFIPIEYCEKVYDNMSDTTLINEYINGLNAL
jgi:hypothetical protein